MVLPRLVLCLINILNGTHIDKYGMVTQKWRQNNDDIHKLAPNVYTVHTYIPTQMVIYVLEFAYFY
jgi:hypothetical protein